MRKLIVVVLLLTAALVMVLALAQGGSHPRVRPTYEEPVCASVAASRPPDFVWVSNVQPSEPRGVLTTFANLHDSGGDRIRLTGVFHVTWATDGSTPHLLWFSLLDPGRPDGTSRVFLTLDSSDPVVVSLLGQRNELTDRCASVDGKYFETKTDRPGTAFPWMMPVYRLAIWRTVKVNVALKREWSVLPEIDVQ